MPETDSGIDRGPRWLAAGGFARIADFHFITKASLMGINATKANSAAAINKG